MSIRREVSAILKFGIAEDGWEKAFKELEKDGRITKKHITSIIILILKTLEGMEPKKS